MNVLLLCLALAGATQAAQRVKRNYFDPYPQFFPFSDYSQHPFPNFALAQEPYPYYANPVPHATAVCKLVAATGQHVGGDIYFQQADSIGPVQVTGSIFGLSPGLHGFHIHQNGNVTDDCKAAGPHFNPGNKNHGAPHDPVRHAGDLGNIAADAHGFAHLDIIDGEISLVQNNPRQVIGRAIVVHAKEDDLGKGNNEESLKTGNAGSRVACCVIQMAQY